MHLGATVRNLRAGLVLLCCGVALAIASGCGATEGDADLVAGKQLFAERCGSCHVLRRAGTTGVTGPNLDDAFARALRDGFGRGGIEGAVRQQIEFPAEVSPKSPAYMPPDLVTGDDARNVAAYVAYAAAAPGEDTGLLAEAVKKPGGGPPAVARNGVLEIDATAQLAYVTHRARAEPGPLRVRSPNPSGTPHNIAIEGPGVREVGRVVTNGGVSEVTARVRAGEYAFFCTVPGHREGGMEGTLTVE